MTPDPGFIPRGPAPVTAVESRALQAAGGIAHAFGCRGAGPGPGAWRTLDLPCPPALARQVHGIGVADVDAAFLRRPPGDAPEADILITALTGVPVAVFTADCVPIVLWEPSARAVAVVHAGWRGIAADAPGAAVRALTDRYGARAAACHAAVGPAVEGACYEVGEDVRAAFQSAVPGAGTVLRADRAGRWWADLKEAARRQLAARGVPEARIAVSRLCTRCERDSFHSARRDGANAGRQPTVAWIP